MRQVCAILVVAACVLPALAQQRSAPQQQGSPTQPVQMEMVCRDMETTGNYLAPNETMVANKACHAVSVERLGDGAAANARPSSAAQPSAAQPAQPAASATIAAPTPADLFAPPVATTANPSDKTIRVFVTDSESWGARGGWTGNVTKSANATPNAPESPKDAALVASEVDKLVTEVNRQCPQVVVTSDLQKAAFAVTVDHEGKNRMSERNKIVVFNHSGDDIYSAATRGLGDSIGDACKAILSPKK
jgi:hypothetical protein